VTHPASAVSARRPLLPSHLSAHRRGEWLPPVCRLKRIEGSNVLGQDQDIGSARYDSRAKSEHRGKSRRARAAVHLVDG